MVTADPLRTPGLLVRDVVVSVSALVLAWAVVVVGMVLAAPALAHRDGCATCGTSGALVSVAGPVVVALAAALAGLAVTAVRIVDRRVSWPFALVTLGVCLVAVGIEGYSAFVA